MNWGSSYRIQRPPRHASQSAVCDAAYLASGGFSHGIEPTPQWVEYRTIARVANLSSKRRSRQHRRTLLGSMRPSVLLTRPSTSSSENNVRIFRGSNVVSAMGRRPLERTQVVFTKRVSVLLGQRMPHAEVRWIGPTLRTDWPRGRVHFYARNCAVCVTVMIGFPRSAPPVSSCPSLRRSMCQYG